MPFSAFVWRGMGVPVAIWGKILDTFLQLAWVDRALGHRLGIPELKYQLGH